MSKDPEKILHILKKVTMPAADKSAMRFMLVSHIETQARIQKIAQGMNTRRESPFSFNHLLFGKRMIAGTVALLLVASTGVSLAAEDTLPGDLLYGVKIHVTEEVRGALTVGSTAKVKWEKDRVVKRVVETETLIKKKTLTPKRKIEAEAAIKEQIQKFDEVATSEKANPVGVIDATSDLAPTLKAHQEVLATLAVETPSTSTDDIIKTVQEGIVVSDAQESAAIDSISTTTTPLELSTALDEKIIDTEKAIEILSKTDVDSDVNTIIEKQDKKDLKNTVVEEMGTNNDSIENTEETMPNNSVESNTTPLASIEAVAGTTANASPETVTVPETIGTSTQDMTIVAPTTDKNETVATTPAEMTNREIATKVIVNEKIKSDNRKEVLLRAKEMLVLAREKKAKGELGEALRLTQQAYKSVLELNVGTQLSKDATKKEASDTQSDTFKTSEKSMDKKGIVSATSTEAASVVSSETTPIIGVPTVVNAATLQAQTILPTQ